MKPLQIAPHAISINGVDIDIEEIKALRKTLSLTQTIGKLWGLKPNKRGIYGGRAFQRARRQYKEAFGE